VGEGTFRSIEIKKEADWMKKRRQGKRLLAWMLCVALTAAGIIPSAAVQVSASEPEAAQEDFFETETYSGGIQDIDIKDGQNEMAENGVQSVLVKAEEEPEPVRTQEEESVKDVETQEPGEGSVEDSGAQEPEKSVKQDADSVETQTEGFEENGDIIETQTGESATAETEVSDAKSDLEPEETENTDEDLEGTGGNYTLSVGDKKSLYTHADKAVVGAAWTSSDYKAVEILSQDTVSCQIEIKAYTASRVLIHCLYYYNELFNGKIYQRQGYTDYYITIKQPQVTVSFDANGGSVSPDSTSRYTGNTYGTLPTPVRSGYTFEGWYTSAKGGTKITANTTVSASTDHTLYAHWEILPEITVLFDANGGSVDTPQKTVICADSYGSLPIPQREGYTFLGWFTSADGGERIESSTTVTKTVNHKIYAHWGKNITVIFDANGGKTPTASKIVTKTLAYGELPVPTRSGWTFDGWYTQAEGGSLVTEKTIVPLDEAHTIYAHWQHNFTVTFHANGGSTPVGTKIVTFGSPYGELPTPVREDYGFIGWFTAQKGGEQITEKTIVNLQSSQVLYAHWGAICTLHFDANGGTVSQSIMLVTDGTSYGKLPVAEYSGYCFTGWYTEPKGGERITADMQVVPKGEQILYAHWSKQCTITFDAGEGSGAPSKMTAPAGEAVMLPRKAPTKGYSCFLGWDNERGRRYYPGDSILVEDDITLTASYGIYYLKTNEAITYDIIAEGTPKVFEISGLTSDYYTFQCIDAKTNLGAPMKTKMEVYRQTSSNGNVTRTLIGSCASSNSTFVGYSFKSEKRLDNSATYLLKIYPNSSREYGTVTIAVSQHCNIRYNANWKERNGTAVGVVVPDVQTPLRGVQTQLSSKVPVRKNHTFVGWSKKATYTSSDVLYQPGEYIIPKDAEMTLYAIWRNNDLYNATIIPSDTKYSDSYQADICYDGQYVYYQFTPDTDTYYRFHKESQVSASSYKMEGTIYIYDENKYQIVCEQNFSSVTQYMKKGKTYYIAISSWDPTEHGTVKFTVQKGYKIQYNANGGTDAPDIVYKYGTESVKITSLLPMRVPYKFTGWSSVSEGSGTLYKAGDLYQDECDLTLYAVWEQDTVEAISDISQDYVATISNKGGYQCYQFIPDEDESYSFKWVNDGTISRIQMRLYDSESNLLQSKDGSTSACVLSASLKAGAVYYLKVLPYSSSDTGTIHFQITKAVKTYGIHYDGNGGDIYATSGTVVGQVEYYKQMIGTKGHDTDYVILDASKILKATFPIGSSGDNIQKRTVTFNASGGSCDTSTISLSFEFASWKRDDTGEIMKAGDIYKENAPLDLTAQWKLKEAVSLPEAVRSKYDFIGWYTDPDEGTKITDLADLPFQDSYTLYAHWMPLKSTVHFDANGGSVVMESMSVFYDTAYGELPVPIREGYTFQGWYKSVSGRKVWINSISIVDTAEEHTLYAAWREGTGTDTCVVVFDTQNHGTAPQAYIDIIRGSIIEAPQEPTAEDYRFLGWFKDAECTQKWNFATDTVQEDIILYAKWLSDTEEEKLVWNIDEQGKLTVKGVGDFAAPASGDMDSDYNRAPWYDEREKIKSAQINVTEMTDASYMFCGCTNLTSVSLEGFDTTDVTNTECMFAQCENLEHLDLSGFHTENVTNMLGMFSDCANLTSLNLDNFHTENVTNMSALFDSCAMLDSVDIRHFNTGNVTDMSGMFYNCSQLSALDLSGFDTGNVTDMTAMFNGCIGLKTLNVGSFDTRKVTSMYGMFSGCEALADLDVGSFDTKNVIDMRGMFGDCRKLTKLDLGNFDTGNVLSMRAMFSEDEALTDLDIRSFDTKNVMDMAYLFYGCSALRTLDLSGFDAANVSDAENMLSGCTRLDKISTPYHLSVSVVLPQAKTSDIWYDAAGKTYTELPDNLAHGMILEKNKKPVISEPYLAVTKGKTVYKQGETLNIDDLKVSYCDSNGIIKKISEGYSTNADTVDMSVAGDKLLTVSYMDTDVALTITVLPLTEQVVISGITMQNSAYNGTAAVYNGTAAATLQDGTDVTNQVTFTYTYSGTQADGSSYGDTTDAPTNAGNYTLTVSIAEGDEKYTGSAVYPFQIEKAPITIQADNILLAIGDPIPDYYGYHVAGLVNGESLLVKPTLKCEAADTEKVGVYDIVPAGADAGMNYEITYQNGILTIAEQKGNYYTVTFELGGHGVAIAPLTAAAKDSLINEPQEPTEEGYRFLGWFKDPSCTVLWKFDTDTIQEDTTLYAGWISVSPGGDGNFGVQQIHRQTYTGKAIKPEVYVYSADGSAMLRAGKDYTVKYYNNIDADRTDSDGGVSGTGTEDDNGFTKKLPYVVIMGKGNYSGTIYQNFHIDPVSIGDKNPAKGVALKYKDQFAIAKKAQKPFQSIKYKKAMKAGVDYDITLESVTCDADGAVLNRVPVDKGSANPSIPSGSSGTFLMTVTGKGNYSGTIEKFIYVADKDHLMKNAKITLGKNLKSVPYEKGKPATLTASETAGDNVFTVRIGKTVLPPSDYCISYTGNDAVGMAVMTVAGKGEYAGTKSISFRITGTAFTAKNISVIGFQDTMMYNGKNLVQSDVTVKEGSAVLECGKHYTVSYKNNRKKGTAVMTFTGNPYYGYSSSFKKTFKITAAPLDIKTLSVTATDYAVTSDGGNIRLEGSIAYTKAGAKPSGKIMLKGESGTVLKQGTDYTVSYKIPKTTGDASMIIKGKGNYGGSLTIYYMVEKAHLDGNGNLTASAVPMAFDSKKTEGYEYHPKMKLADGKKALAEGKDYTVTSYHNCTQENVRAYLAALKGSVPDAELAALMPYAKVTAVGAGNYMGSVDVPLVIYETKLVKKNLRIEVSEDTAVYTGGQVKPEVTVYYGSKKLENGRDYTLSYGTNSVAGKNKGSVTVNGAGLYGGSVTQKFTIQGKNIYAASKQIK